MGTAEKRKSRCADGHIENLNTHSQQTATVRIETGDVSECGEALLNVKYVQKNREGLIPAGHVVAKAVGS